MESSMNMLRPPTGNSLPDLSKTLTNFFGGGAPPPKSSKAKTKR